MIAIVLKELNFISICDFIQKFYFHHNYPQRTKETLMEQEQVSTVKKFFKNALFFETMLIPKILTFIYWINLVIIGLSSLVIWVGAVVSQGIIGIFTGAIVAILYFCISAILTRMIYEIIVVFFRINDHTFRTAECLKKLTERKAAPPATPKKISVPQQTQQN